MGPYPGLGLPLRHWPQADFRLRYDNPSYPNGAHPNIAGSKSELLPVREVSMMGVMEKLTDKKDWHKKVFDDTICDKWREEAMAIPDEVLMKAAAAPQSEWDQEQPVRLYSSHGDVPEAPTRVKGIMSKAAFDYCIQELRSKARYFEKTGIIPTLNASMTVVKSDVLVKDDLREALRQAFQTLKDDQADSPDWHPGSNDTVRDLVHPSMYPLIYGRSKVFEDEVVGVSDAVEKWAGKGKVIEKDETPAQVQWGRYSGVALGSPEVPASYWSNAYQWLPSNVAFQEDGSVKFTSYINNLHPTRYPGIYSTIEKLIETALPAWDHCLLEYRMRRRSGAARKISRFGIPEDADDEVVQNWDPSDPAEMVDVELDPDQAWRYEDDEDKDVQKWKFLRTPVLREPLPFSDFDYSPEGDLRKNFQKSGLQVIVKLASIELSPEKPEFSAGGWHIEGQLNEGICATALYYLDSENITDSSLSFRMHTSYDQQDLQEAVGQDSYHWLECVYGTNLSHGGMCIQNYGSVETPEGRLLAFPNVFQHRVSPFRLADPTKPGHRRFIALWLVDPHRRIISTANVPPQQQDWWMESVFGKSEDSQKSAADRLPAEMVQLLQEKGVAVPGRDEKASLPPELLDIVRKEFDLSTLSLEEAKQHRIQLMEVRGSQHAKALDTWRSASYSFCEH